MPGLHTLSRQMGTCNYVYVNYENIVTTNTITNEIPIFSLFESSFLKCRVPGLHRHKTRLVNGTIAIIVYISGKIVNFTTNYNNFRGQSYFYLPIRSDLPTQKK